MRTRTIRLPDGRSLSWRDSWWHLAARAAAATATLVVVVAIGALLVVPKATGGAALTVLTGSMRPALAPGDVAVVRGITADQVCSQVSVGQIITYLPAPGSPDLVTHRVVGLSVGDYPDGAACQLVTRGDANSTVDDPVSPAQVRGVLMYRVPTVGLVRGWVGEHAQTVMIAAALAAIAYGLWTTLRRPRTRVVTIPQTPGPSTEDEPGERETALARREAELRDRELAFARRAAPGPGDEGPGGVQP